DGHQPAVVDGGEIATRGAPDELEADNSIEAILARSRRKELVARVRRLGSHGNGSRQSEEELHLLIVSVADFQVVNFGQMPDVLERPFPTMLILFHPATFASKVFVPALRDLEGLLRKAEIPVSITALDLTASPHTKCVQEEREDSKPGRKKTTPGGTDVARKAVAPHIQLILPRSMDGEAGVVDYDGVWDARSLAKAACGMLPSVRLRHKVSHRLGFLAMELQNTFLGCKKEELPAHKRSLSLPPRPSKACVEGDAEIQSYVRNLGHRALQLQPLVVRSCGTSFVASMSVCQGNFKRRQVNCQQLTGAAFVVATSKIAWNAAWRPV
ncbi:unnamed protein product, partial [Symbiodinium necroappetens]